MDMANAVTPGTQGDVAGLSDRDRDVLDFERQWWKYAGAKEQAVREKFGMSSTRYYQVLNALIDRPEALAFDPLLVRPAAVPPPGSPARPPPAGPVRPSSRLRDLTCGRRRPGSRAAEPTSAVWPCPRRSPCWPPERSWWPGARSC